MVNIDDIQHVRRTAQCLVSPDDVELAIEKMAVEISDKIGHKNPVLLCVMSGGVVVFGKLLTKLDFPLSIDYLHATRYRGEITGDDVQWKAKPLTDLRNRTVLIVDDILDEGNTLAAIIDYCKDSGAEDVFSAVLVDKKHERKYQGIFADFTGLSVADKYIFGEGMDYHGYLRNMSGIYALK